MRKTRLSFAIVLLCLLVGALAAAQDWPQWRGPARDGKVTGFTAPETWPQALTQQWTVTVGTGDATPALVGDRLYVFTRQAEEEVTSCLNVADGTQLWQDRIAAAPVTGPGARHPGPRATPAVAEGKVVTLGAAGVISCLDAATGAVAWRKDVFPGAVPRFFTSSSPIIANGTTIAQLGGPGNGGILAFDLASGEEKWRWAVEGPDYASPVLMTVGDVQTVVALTEKSVVGVALADGTLLWQLPFVPSGRAYNSATPLVDGPISYYSGSGRGTFAVRIDKQDDTFTPTQLWSNAEVACQYSSPVLREGFLYGVSDKGSLFCLNAANGQAAWVDAAPTDKGSYSPMVDAGSVLFALPTSGELIVLKPDSAALNVLARLKLAQTPTYAYPVISGKRIIVKDEQAVTAWALP